MTDRAHRDDFPSCPHPDCVALRQAEAAHIRAARRRRVITDLSELAHFAILGNYQTSLKDAVELLTVEGDRR